MKFLSLYLTALVLLLAGCMNDSGGGKHEIRIDAFSDYLLYLRSNSAKQGDTLVVNVIAPPLPIPIGWGENDTLILYKKGYDSTAGLPAHGIDTVPPFYVAIGDVIHKSVLYASDARPESPLSCRIDNRGKKFVRETAYDTGDVFEERLHDGTVEYYRLIDTAEAIINFPCSFYLGKGYYVNYSGTNIRYYGDIIIQY